MMMIVLKNITFEEGLQSGEVREESKRHFTECCCNGDSDQFFYVM